MFVLLEVRQEIFEEGDIREIVGSEFGSDGREVDGAGVGKV